MSGNPVRSDFFATMVLADAHLRTGDLEESRRVANECSRPRGTAPLGPVRELPQRVP